MAKSKNRRKNGKVKKYTGPKFQTVKTVKVPHCKHCGTDTRLATQAELANFRAHDPSFNEPYLFLPECDCWETHKDWMTV